MLEQFEDLYYIEGLCLKYCQYIDCVPLSVYSNVHEHFNTDAYQYEWDHPVLALAKPH